MNAMLSKITISSRLWLMVAISILCVFAINAIDTRHLDSMIYEQKETKTRQLVEVAHSVLAHFQQQQQNGSLTQEQAQAAAMRVIKQLRYDQKEYFWINDMSPLMVMHPYKPQLDGKDLSGFKDPAGKALFVAFVDKVKSEGGGFVEYLWPKPGQDKPVRKISYVKGFAPWGWIIGSGIYLDDLDALFWQQIADSLIRVFLIIILLASITFTLAQSITKPIRHTVDLLKNLARGEADLSNGLTASGNDEMAELAREFNRFVEKLHGLVNQLMKTSESLIQSTNQVGNIANETNASTHRQQQESEQVATAMTELQATATDVAHSASQAASAAQHASEMARNGQSVVTGNQRAIATLDSNIHQAAEIIKQLQNKSENIGGILETIRAIADQTNLLALNAAIEAARAGDQGRGFAVVADEVRTLAQRTQTSTQEIEQMILELQQGSDQAVTAMEGGLSEAESAVAGAKETGTVLEEIVSSVSRIDEMNAQIATAAEEQSAVVGEINKNVVRISDIAGQNTEGAAATVAATDEISLQLNHLMGLATSFRLGKNDAAFDFSAARSAHLAWVGRVQAHLDGKKALNEDELLSHKHCALGKWYYGSGLMNYGQIDAMKNIEQPHERLHQTIRECVDLQKQGNTSGARQKLAELKALSKRIVGFLDEVEGQIQQG